MNLLEADTGGNIVTLERPECAQLFLIYAGAAGRVEGMDPMTFLRMSGLMRRNVVFVRDPEASVSHEGISASYWENGVSADLPDLDAVIDWHRAYIDARPHITEIYTLGNSFGGWAAMFFGYMLGLKRVYAMAAAGSWGRDLLADLMVDSNGITEYDLYYSRDQEKDRIFAETFAGYPGVNLMTRDEHGHQMLKGLLHSGELTQILPEALAAA